MTAYLDHAATTPLVPAAKAALVTMLDHFGNASSLHTSGRNARRFVEESRETIAGRLGASPSDVIFTAGGTEANNLAIKGVFFQGRREDRQQRRILVSAVEHHAVLDPAMWLTAEGAIVEQIPVDSVGRIRLDLLAEIIAADPDSISLISIMWANNEVGTVQPIAEIVELAKTHGIPVHSDAVQAVGSVPVDFAASGLSALTLSAHKLGGPTGVGALLARRDLTMVPILHGGGQERSVRSGTLDVQGIVGFAAAIDTVVAGLDCSAPRIGALRDRLIAGITQLDSTATLSGATPGPGRLPGNAHFIFPRCEGDSLLYLLDAQGVQVSTGSACRAGVAQPSHVLSAMGLSDDNATGALRFSLGYCSTETDVDRALAALPEVLVRARNAWKGIRKRR